MIWRLRCCRFTPLPLVSGMAQRLSSDCACRSITCSSLSMQQQQQQQPYSSGTCSQNRHRDSGGERESGIRERSHDLPLFPCLSHSSLSVSVCVCVCVCMCRLPLSLANYKHSNPLCPFDRLSHSLFPTHSPLPPDPKSTSTTATTSATSRAAAAVHTLQH